MQKTRKSEYGEYLRGFYAFPLDESSHVNIIIIH